MLTYKLSTRKNEYGEYVIKAWKDGKRYPDADYHTDDKTDAESTLKLMEIEAKKLAE
jgi:hypothetical protein